MHVHAVIRVHAVTPKLVICVMFWGVWSWVVLCCQSEVLVVCCILLGLG